MAKLGNMFDGMEASFTFAPIPGDLFNLLTGYSNPVDLVISLTAAAVGAPGAPGVMISSEDVTGLFHRYDKATLHAALYQDDDAHDTCSLTACLNPLHPGPCKGWKGTLFNSAPAAWHALEAAKVDKANTNRLKKIQDLKDKGLPIPKKLLTPHVAKPHPHAGKTANAAGGEAHAASEAISEASGVHVNEPGKVTLGQAIKVPAVDATDELGPKGKKPTVASKGIAHVIAQEKVTPQYKLDKAATITPAQWNALSSDEKSVIRGELQKIKQDGFGPQQKKASILLGQLPAEGKVVDPIAEAQAKNADALKAVADEVKKAPIKVQAAHEPGKPKTLTPEQADKQAKNAADQAAKEKVAADIAAKASPPVVKEMTEAPKPTLSDAVGKPKKATFTATHNGVTVTRTSAKDYTHAAVVHLPWKNDGKGEDVIYSFHTSPELAAKAGLAASQKKSGMYVKAVIPVTKLDDKAMIKKVTDKVADVEKPKPAHVQEAIDMAHGTAPGASWSKNHLATYQKMSADDFNSLPPDTQDKVVAELNKAQTKLLDPKKIQASKDLLAKFGKAPITPKVEPPKPTATKVEDMTAAQIQSRAEEILGKEYANPKTALSLAELQDSNKEGKAAALEIANDYPTEILADPNVSGKYLSLVNVLSHIDATKKEKAKLDQHIAGAHAMGLKLGLDPNGNKLTDADKAVLKRHVELLNAKHGHLDAALADSEAKLAPSTTVFKAAADKAVEVASKPPVHALGASDEALIIGAYANGWAKQANKVLVYGAKTYDQTHKMKAHPDYPALKEETADLKNLAGQVALAHAREHTAQLNVPTDPDSGDMITSSPEWQAWQDAADIRAHLEKGFADKCKSAQAKMDAIRGSVGLPKRALPKVDSPAVKAYAAEKGNYESAYYGAVNHNKPAAAKNYMLAKAGPKIAVVHKTSADKANEKAAKVAKSAPPMPAPKVHVKPPSELVGEKPNAATAAKQGYHYTDKPPVAGGGYGDWKNYADGGAYVSSPEGLADLRKHLEKPDTKFGEYAKNEFGWSIENMQSKGASSAGKGSLYSYTGSGFSTVNNKLNSLPPGTKKTGSTTISNIDAAFAASPPLAGDVVLYRGFSSPGTVFSSGKWNEVNVAGMEWSQRSYSSTSSALSTAQGFAGGYGVVMRIIVPKELGVKGISAKGGQHPGENEIILQRGLRYRVVADYGKHAGRRYIDVMVVPNPYDKAE